MRYVFANNWTNQNCIQMIYNNINAKVWFNWKVFCRSWTGYLYKYLFCKVTPNFKWPAHNFETSLKKQFHLGISQKFRLNLNIASAYQMKYLMTKDSSRIIYKEICIKSSLSVDLRKFLQPNPNYVHPFGIFF